jgi:hypothetical protein
LIVAISDCNRASHNPQNPHKGGIALTSVRCDTLAADVGKAIHSAECADSAPGVWLLGAHHRSHLSHQSHRLVSRCRVVTRVTDVTLRE